MTDTCPDCERPKAIRRSTWEHAPKKYCAAHLYSESALLNCNRATIANLRLALASATEQLRQVEADAGWMLWSVRKPAIGQSICFTWGDRAVAGTVDADGRLYRWSSAYPVETDTDYAWCPIPSWKESNALLASRAGGKTDG